MGRGGIAAVARASGISQNTIRKGMREIESGERLEGGRVRRRGGGRKPIGGDRSRVGGGSRAAGRAGLSRRSDAGAVVDVEERSQAGRRVAGAWVRCHLHDGRAVCCARSATACRPTARRREGTQHPDRDAQFRHINERVAAAIARRRAGDLDRHQEERARRRVRQRGASGGPRASPIKVSTHDFPSKPLGKAIPYGVYDIARQRGIRQRRDHHDTAQFAVASIRALVAAPRPGALPAPPARCRSRPTAAAATATASGCGRPNCRSSPTRPVSTISRLPLPARARASGTRSSTGCSAYISQNWRGRPLISYEVIINSIAATTTSTGLKVFARLDQRDYPKKVEVTDAELAAVNITPRPVPPRVELHDLAITHLIESRFLSQGRSAQAPTTGYDGHPRPRRTQSDDVTKAGKST